MRPLNSRILGLLVCLVMAGCQSEYSRSYRSTMGSPSPSVGQYRGMNLVAYTGTPRVVESSLSPQEQIHYLEEGWVPLGESNFYAPLESDGALTDQAKKIGAELVLLSRTLGQTVTGVTPYTTYEPITAYRFRGQGNGPTRVDTAIVPYTEYMPYAENWYAQRAVYYTRRIQPPSFGALCRDLTSDDRKRLGFNAGVSVICCVQDTPAWNAGILPDDVLVSLGGSQIDGVGDLRDIVQQNAGKTVPVQYMHGGEKRTISVTLGPGNSGE